MELPKTETDTLPTTPLPPNSTIRPQSESPEAVTPDSSGIPPTSPPAADLQTQAPIQPKKSKVPKIAMVILAGLMVAGAASAGYLYGKRQPSTTTEVTPPVTDIKIPDGATVTAECIDGLGKQYVLPKDIPFGPIYNVHEGKVIGVEYMFGADEITKDPARFMSLAGFSHNFDHINIDFLPGGHAGDVGAHYHIDLLTIPKDEAAAIKCSAEQNAMPGLHTH